MRFSRYIASRYLRSPKSHSVINIISGVSIVAMATPVAAVVLLLSIFNGLEDMVRSLYKVIDADIIVTPAEGTTLRVEDIDTAAMRRINGVEYLTLSLEQGVMAEVGEQRTIVQLKGVDEAFRATLPIAESVVLGTFTTQLDDSNSLVVGSTALQQLGVMPSSAVGQQVNLYAINRKRISSLLPIGGYTRRTMPIAGVYNIDEENGRRIYTSLRMAQQLLNYPNRISAIEFSLSADASPKEVAAQIAQCAAVEVRALTRNESNSIYRLMALEKWGVFFIALVVMLIASLSIVGTLVMVIIDKQQDMHTLRTMGASPALIRDIFIAEGHLMAAISLVGGVVLGGALALAQQHWGMVGIDTQTLLISAYPVEVHLSDILLTIVSYIIIAHIVIKLTVRATTRHQI